MGKNPDGTTINENPIPDSEKAADQSAYDVDFEYLGTEKKEGEENADRKNDEQLPDSKNSEAKPENKEGKKEEVKEDKSKASEGQQEDVISEVLAEVTGVKPEPKKITPENFDSEIQARETKISDLTAQLRERDTQLEQLKDFKTGVEKLQSDPEARIEFIRKTFPELAGQLDPRKPILEQLKKEFGETFRFDANEAYEEGTPSYKYRLREEELRDHQFRERQQQQATILQKQQELQGRIESSKRAVMKQYGLTEEQYQKEIVEYGKGLTPLPEHIAMIRFYKDNLKKVAAEAIAQSKKRASSTDRSQVSSADVSGTDGEDDKGSSAYREHMDEFGDV